MEEHPLSLYELNALVKRSIHACLPDTYWVQAELSDVRSNYSGHCYLEFVQKEPRGNNLIAKARGTIWSNVYRLLKPYFEEETGQAFVAGIKVMVKVTVEFHELYGYSLTVQDIDPTYTLGDMARRRREILKQLEEEGVLTLNKELEIPLLAQRIAVISSATAAGYGDFCNQLEQNSYGFVFYPHLFPAIMQGERVEQSVITALDAIHACRDDWDVVVIIRGGGATSDLSGFDTYELAANCAQFPIPIITGIGHERDDTVLDFVSHTRVKTPTAAAEYLINHLHDTAKVLEDYASAVLHTISTRMERENTRLNHGRTYSHADADEAERGTLSPGTNHEAFGSRPAIPSDKRDPLFENGGDSVGHRFTASSGKGKASAPTFGAGIEGGISRKFVEKGI